MLRCNHLNENTTEVSRQWIQGTRITFSSLTNYKLEEYNANTYSIKYVLQGTEHYVVDRQKFSVSGGNYLLVNKNQPIDAQVKSTKKVLGFCIHMEEELLQEMYAQLLLTQTELLDEPTKKFAIPPFENLLYNEKENELGQFLQRIVKQFQPDSTSIAIEPTEFYNQLSQHLLATQNNLPKTASQLGLIRNSTKQELLRRLQMAKDIMDSQDMESFNIDILARQCALSGSHLFRSFKKVYGISPYQYLLQQKLRKAADLLKTENITITNAALLCGFSDLPSFSKAFKRMHRISPSAYSMQKSIAGLITQGSV